MGRTRDIFEGIRERHLIEVPNEYFLEHYEVFKHPNTRHVKTIINDEDDMFKNDPKHKLLLDEYMKANKALRDYKYDKIHNHKIKSK